MATAILGGHKNLAKREKQVFLRTSFFSSLMRVLTTFTFLLKRFGRLTRHWKSKLLYGKHFGQVWVLWTEFKTEILTGILTSMPDVYEISRTIDHLFSIIRLPTKYRISYCPLSTMLGYFLVSREFISQWKACFLKEIEENLGSFHAVMWGVWLEETKDLSWEMSYWKKPFFFFFVWQLDFLVLM